MKKLFSVLLIFLFNLLFFSVSSSYASTIFEDNFTAPDGTQLINHNSFWQSFTNLNNGIISNNQVHSSNGQNSDYYIPSLVNQSDYCVQADFNYPLPQTSPPDFFGISTRGDTIQYTHHYSVGLSSNGSLGLGVGPNLLYSGTANLSNGPHTLKLCSVGVNHSIYLDNNLITIVVDSTYSSGAPGFDLGNNTPIDNFIVTTPPDNQVTDLNVPTLKQGILPFTDANPWWEINEFDHADQFGGFFCGRTIAQCGCAMTSTTMIFEYYGITKLPDGTTFDPGTFNTWLKNNNGYFRDEGLNPYVAATVAKKAKSMNPNFTFDSLEYSRTGEDKNQLTTDLQNGIPDVLEEPGHFIVAKGINGNTFDINDPYYNRTSLTAYNDHFISLGRFVGANSDNSYLVFAMDKDLNPILKNQLATSVGNSYLQNHLIDPSTVSGIATPTPSLKILADSKPSSGSYQLEVSSPTLQTYQLDAYLIDQDGNNKLETFKGITGPNFSNTYSIYFDKNDVNNSTFQKIVTFESTLQDIKGAQNLSIIGNGLAMDLVNKLNNAQKQIGKHNDIAHKLLQDAIKSLNSSFDHTSFISQDAYIILFEDLSSLDNSF